MVYANFFLFPIDGARFLKYYNSNLIINSSRVAEGTGPVKPGNPRKRRCQILQIYLKDEG